MMFYRGEHFFVENGKQVYVKLGESSYQSLEMDDEPCKDRFPNEASYSEVCRYYYD